MFVYLKCRSRVYYSWFVYCLLICLNSLYRLYQPSTGLDLLKVQKVSQEQSWQRTGRAGRESAGTCYRVFTKEVEFYFYRK